MRNLYSFAPRPDRTFYFRVPVAVSLRRKIASRLKISYYEAGMDLGLSDDVIESYEKFQTRLKREYDRLAGTVDFVVINAEHPVEKIQFELRRQVRPLLANFPTAEHLIHDQ